MSHNRITRWLLDQAPQLGLSDNALAQAIDVTPQAISKCRLRGAHMSDRTCLAVAALVGVQPQIALILLYADRTQDPRAARMLEDVAQIIFLCYAMASSRQDKLWQLIALLLPMPSKLNLAPSPRPSRKTGPRRKLSKRRAPRS